MKVIYETSKPKKFVGKKIGICISCGSNKTSSSEFTIFCKDCGELNFYDGI